MEIKAGTTVRISHDLSKTKVTFGMNDRMIEMKGRIIDVDRIMMDQRGRNGTVANAIMIPDKDGTTWSFCEDDLTQPIETPPIPPVMFDPENIER